MSAPCFHCGEPVTVAAFPVLFDGIERPTCCRGCQAVAQAIVGEGLGDYYRARSAPALRPRSDEAAAARLALYDNPALQNGFVRADPASPGVKEAAVLLDGVTCGACMWLIERRLAGMPGVLGFEGNYAQRRARIRWDEATTRLSDILAAIQALGYGVQPYDAARAGAALEAERRGLLWRLFVAGLGMMQVMMYAVPVYMADGTMTRDVERLMQIAGLLLTAPVVAWAAVPFYLGALREARRRRLGMDIPIALAVLASFAASAAATLLGSGDVYFDTVAMFVFLLLLARYLELGARVKAADAQTRLAKLAPLSAERLDDYPASDAPREVPAVTLHAGDVVLVRAGATIPADGVVLAGRGAVDESLLTGESRSVWKAPGDDVVCGAINKHAPLVVRVERIGEQSMLAGIGRLMDRAQSERPRIARLAERAAGAFVAMVLALALIAAVGWNLIDPARAFWVTVALLVVACPCALSLATPSALTAASGFLYRRGVLLTRGHALETLARATHFVFDKTGTLTSREQRLVGVMPLASETDRRCLAIAAALEAQAEHPVARAVVAANRCADAIAVTERASDVGKGVEARIEGLRYRLGTPDYVRCTADRCRSRSPSSATKWASWRSATRMAGSRCSRSPKRCGRRRDAWSAPCAKWAPRYACCRAIATSASARWRPSSVSIRCVPRPRPRAKWSSCSRCSDGAQSWP